MDRQKKIYLTTQAILLTVFLGIIIYASWKYAPSVTRLFRDPGKFREFLSSYGAAGPLVYMALSAVQVIVAIIPGEIVQIAGGYAWGSLCSGRNDHRYGRCFRNHQAPRVFPC